MKQSLIKNISLALIAIGIFLIIIQPFQPVTTGAVIDLSTTVSKINFVFSFILIIVGISIQLKLTKKKN
jgi:hypothetical protein